MRPTILHKYFKFYMIRFTDYGGRPIAQKTPRRSFSPNLSVHPVEKICFASKSDCQHFKSRRPLSPCKVWGRSYCAPAAGAKMWCLFICLIDFDFVFKSSFFTRNCRFRCTREFACSSLGVDQREALL